MSNHLRYQYLLATQSKLEDTGVEVKIGKIIPIQADVDLPMIVLSPEAEERVPRNLAAKDRHLANPRSFGLRCTFTMVMTVLGESWEEVHQLAANAEMVIDTIDFGEGPLVATSVAFDEDGTETERPLYSLQMAYDLVYDIASNDPTVVG